MVNENNSARICALRSRTIRPVREGAYWEKEEIELLEEMFNSGAGITEIALVLERSEPAVVQQIEKLDLYGGICNDFVNIGNNEDQQQKQ